MMPYWEDIDDSRYQLMKCIGMGVSDLLTECLNSDLEASLYSEHCGRPL